MSSTPGSSQRDTNRGSIGSDSHDAPTTAAFSPVNLSNSCSTSKRRSIIIVHQKSSLLVTTPPQITRVLVYSHIILLPLNKLVGLVTWTSGDPWESFLLVVAFWATTLYGDVVIRYATPLVITIILLICVYTRRSTKNLFTNWAREEKFKIQKKNINPETSHVKHQITLEEIVETLRTFTNRCQILLDPFYDFFDNFEIQTSRSMFAKHWQNSLFLRLLLFSIAWIVLNLEPIQLITTKRSVIFFGTLAITWHSQPNRVARAILWRSAIIRRFCSSVTGLQRTIPTSLSGLDENSKSTSLSSEKTPLTQESNSSIHPLKNQNFTHSFGIKFTFSIYENQRRWVGLGWTTNLFAYERAAWTDEHLIPVPPKEQFQLPVVEDSSMAWKWVDGSIWMADGVGEVDEGDVKASDSADEKMGWIYYDNKWQHGRRGIDGWGCYTRRRKWYRDAELVEIPPSSEIQ
ncbi:Peroxisomal membrane protein PEX30 [Erysiphe neolycopersici]|uniref:Peroxisomal membrane protein PEX30 n=1 Tax=Erysiphe neolycopersici TaxID=212602 RepID=A0A420I2V5_9PEZI|nr:Peroxisomal membrane protein PEX30 [Erysiphe neolycopersici]